MREHTLVLPPSNFTVDSRRARAWLVVFCCALALFGMAVSGFDFGRVVEGLVAIARSPDILINDYAGIAGMGPAFINASICAFMAVLLLRLTKVKVTGPLIAGVFTIAGFALFGKNPLNILPGFFGAFLYSVLNKRPFSENIVVALFGTALAPLSSEVAFGLGIAFPWNIALAIAVGTVAGFLLSPLARHVLDFHRGYNLYNMGFAAGFIGTVTMSALKAFGIKLSGGFVWAELGPLPAVPFLASLFVMMIVIGVVIDRRWMDSYRELLWTSGRLVSDFVRFFGMGATLVNMGIMGLVATTVVFIIGGSWNGPMIGGVLTIVGFAAFGKHPKNALPPMIGAAVMASLSRYGLDSPGRQLAVLFASTLAPIAGEYGAVAGFSVGMLHLVLVQIVGGLHGGLDLYNNGFAGGLSAGIMVPILEWLREWRRNEV